MSKEDNRFPVLDRKGDKRWVKWSELSDKMAMDNHSQTLKRLAERGGLCARELVGNIEGIGWSDLMSITEEHAEEVVKRIEAPTKAQ